MAKLIIYKGCKGVIKMARGRPIPGLEQAIEAFLYEQPGTTARIIHRGCEGSLGTRLLLSTVNSALRRLTREGVLRKRSPEGRKVPFIYFPEEKEQENEE